MVGQYELEGFILSELILDAVEFRSPFELGSRCELFTALGLAQERAAVAQVLSSPAFSYLARGPTMDRRTCNSSPCHASQVRPRISERDKPVNAATATMTR
jgi:hypothetical protein